MSRILVIAYGNPLRGDDGVAWQAAEELKRESPRSTQVMCVHQLTPELAETASCADIVVFLDAARDGDPGGVTCQTVCARPSEMHFSHHLAPGEILALCDRLYSTCPHAFLISIHGKSFEHSGELTPAVISAIPQAVALVHELVKQLAACEQPITNI